MTGLDFYPLLPNIPIVRLLALIVGAAVFVHMICMANFMPKNAPALLVAQVSVGAAAGVGLFLGGITGSADLLVLCALASSACSVSIMLWLWWHGMHVSSFVIQRFIESKQK